jgi:N-acetyl sugar amidotransferase
MVTVGKYCTRGVWDESIPGIEFDDNGVCNYAKLHDTLVEAFPKGDKGKQDWENILKKIQNSNRNKPYNCVIGVSGGTDSSYLLYLAKKAGLRPLAVNLDNGWNSDIAVKNIKKMTTALDIDLETYVIEYEEIKDLLRSYMRAGLPWIDIPTDLAIKSVLYKIATREGIKYVLRGNDFRSEGSQPNEWTYGDGRQLLSVHKKFGSKRLKTFPNYTFLNIMYYGFIRQVKSIYPYYYLDYNKQEAMTFLKDNYDWEYYGGHHYENHFTRFAITYWLFEKFNIDKRIITYSAQILSGEMDRETALRDLQDNPYDKKEIDETIRFVLKKMDIKESEFKTMMSAQNKSHKDYPSYSFLFDNMLAITKPILKLIFVHKPQSLFQSEMRNSK